VTNRFSMSLIFSAATLIAAAPYVFGANGALYVFSGTPAGASPIAPLTSNRYGNLYGTTQLGGPADQGTVFELSPNASGGYTFTQLYAFQSGVGDAQIPDAGALLLDPAGNLYGTTPTGGAFGGGAVYEVSPQPAGGWVERVIFSFPQDSSVWFPNGGLIMDASGSIYGTAEKGGTYNGGRSTRPAWLRSRGRIGVRFRGELIWGKFCGWCSFRRHNFPIDPRSRQRLDRTFGSHFQRYRWLQSSWRPDCRFSGQRLRHHLHGRALHGELCRIGHGVQIVADFNGLGRNRVAQLPGWHTRRDYAERNRFGP